jgi:hypothetical protein
MTDVNRIIIFITAAADGKSENASNNKNDDNDAYYYNYDNDGMVMITVIIIVIIPGMMRLCPHISPTTVVLFSSREAYAKISMILYCIL